MARLEIACFNAESADIAQANGADRVELCQDQSVGGTSPNLEVVQSVKERLTIPVRVMVRPRGGNFVYNEQEFEEMQKDVDKFSRCNVDGFVFGILNEYGTIDYDRCQRLVRQARRPCTFHRAFDEISEENMMQALEFLIELNFTSVLTSGGKKDAVAGKDMLRRLVDAARGRIDIIVGGGVRSSNFELLRKETRAETFHSSAVVGDNEIADDQELKKLRGLATAHISYRY